MKETTEDTENTEKRRKEGRCPGRGLLFAFLSVFSVSSVVPFLWGGQEKRLDSAAWGSDHVGKPLPQFASGDECLFCHRNDVGPSWGDNRHGRTVRADDCGGFVLGRGKRQRKLRASAEYGKLEIQTGDPPRWDTETFGAACAGCHASGVDAKKGTFTVRSLDCFVCHGDVPGEHAKDTSLVHLSKKGKDPARVVTSICAQCHARGGTSKSSGRPYANHFVAGDNLFRDFQVDFSDKALAALDPADRHVRENVRDVVVFDKTEVTCLTCHSVHKESGAKHHKAPRGPICANCHEAGKAFGEPTKYEAHSKTCGY